MGNFLIKQLISIKKKVEVMNITVASPLGVKNQAMI